LRVSYYGYFIFKNSNKIAPFPVLFFVSLESQHNSVTALPIKFSISASQLQRLGEVEQPPLKQRTYPSPRLFIWQLPISHPHLLTFHYAKLTLKTTSNFRGWLEIFDFCFAYARYKNNNNIWIWERVHNLR